MRNRGQNQRTFVRIITSPIRALYKARDFYIRSITNCGDQMNYSNPMDAAGRFEALPRSYSVATARSDENEDYKDLVRAASARTMADRIDMDLILRQQREAADTKGLPKSSSVGMGRIDEDKAVDFAEANGTAVGSNFYPRSRSYAVGNGRAVVF